MMAKVLILVLLSVCVLFAGHFTDGEQEYARAQYSKAALSFERFYLKHPSSDSAMGALYKSAQSYFFSRKVSKGSVDKAASQIDKILILQEPEDAYYYKAVLFKTYMLKELGKFPEAVALYTSSSIYATLDTKSLSNVVCYELYKEVGDQKKRDFCLKKIKSTNGMSALYSGVQNKAPVRVARPQIIPIKQGARQSDIGDFSIQVGAFSSKQNAESLKNAYADLGRSVMVQQSKRESGTLYLVWVGKFKSKESAQTYAQAHIAEKEPKFRVISTN
ncbi:MAG: SPOR domain-containing protein [Fibrobacterales bacterium]